MSADGMRVLLVDASYPVLGFPLAAEGPPCLLPVVERSLLEHAVRWLRSYGLGDLHWVARRGEHRGPADWERVQELGVRPAASVRAALMAPGGANAGLRGGEPPPMPLLVLRANLWGLPDLADLARHHQRRGAAATVLRGTYRFGPGQYSYGPPVIALCAPLYARVLARIDPDEPLRDVERFARSRGLGVSTAESDAPVLEVNNTFALLSANLEHLPRIGTAVGHGPVREVAPRVFAGPGVRTDGASLDTRSGAVYLGTKAVLASGSTVVGPALIGARSRVGEGSVVRRSLLLPDTPIADGTLVNQRVVSARFSCPGEFRAAL